MSLFPYNLKAYAASLGIPQGPNSKVYLVDTEHGVDTNTGTTWETPLKTLLKAEDLCVTNKHDTVLFLARATADNPTAAIGWDKSYTHLIGIGSPLYGLGQRCRVVLQAGIVATPAITFSGAGCIVKNMQFSNEKAAGSAAGCVIVSGLRNYFENVFFMSPVATDAASYSLKLGSAENVFVRCTFGQFTNPRTAASYCVWIHGAGNVSRNKFIKCEFLSWGYNADHVHMLFDVDLAAVPHVTWIEDCLFIQNATALTESINDNSTAAGHQIILWGETQFLNCTAVGSTLTYIFCKDNVATGVSGMKMLAVAES